MNNSTQQEAVSREMKALSAVWIVPVLALLIAAFLAWQAWLDKGPEVEITFDHARGIVPQKTPVRYKDVQVGVVESLRLSNDLKEVHVIAEMSPEMEGHLTNNTRFWVVTPRISSSGVSGLDTLLSGVYIEVDPGEPGDEQHQFVGLSLPPLVRSGDNGTSFNLIADSLGSLDISSPVYFRQVKVGEVTGYSLSTNDRQITINFFVHAPYDELVQTDSNFWNVSGIGFELNTSGVEVNLASLSALMSGGVAFDSPLPTAKSSRAESGYDFFLFDSKHEVEEGAFRKQFFYLLKFKESVRGLNAGAPIEYRGFKVGEVEKVYLNTEDPEDSDIYVIISVQPERLGDTDRKTKEEVDALMSTLVEGGLRAYLASGNFITGALYIDFKFSDEEGGQLVAGVPYAELPTGVSVARSFMSQVDTILGKVEQFPLDKMGDSALESLELVKETLADIHQQKFAKQLRRILDKVNQLPVESMGKDLQESVQTLNELVGSLGDISIASRVDSTLENLQSSSTKLDAVIGSTVETLNQMQGTLKTLDGTIAPDSPLYYELLDTIEKVGDAAQSLEVLTSDLSRRPQSLLLGGGDRE